MKQEQFLYSAIINAYNNKEQKYEVKYTHTDIKFKNIIVKMSDNIIHINVTLQINDSKLNTENNSVLNKEFQSIIDITGPNQEFKLLFHCLEYTTNFSKQEISLFLRNHVVFNIPSPKLTSNIRIIDKRIDI